MSILRFSYRGYSRVWSRNQSPKDIEGWLYNDHKGNFDMKAVANITGLHDAFWEALWDSFIYQLIFLNICLGGSVVPRFRTRALKSSFSSANLGCILRLGENYQAALCLNSHQHRALAHS